MYEFMFWDACPETCPSIGVFPINKIDDEGL
jgi:hypothetical protein